MVFIFDNKSSASTPNNPSGPPPATLGNITTINEAQAKAIRQAGGSTNGLTINNSTSSAIVPTPNGGPTASSGTVAHSAAVIRTPSITPSPPAGGTPFAPVSSESSVFASAPSTPPASKPTPPDVALTQAENAGGTNMMGFSQLNALRSSLGLPPYSPSDYYSFVLAQQGQNTTANQSVFNHGNPAVQAELLNNALHPNAPTNATTGAPITNPITATVKGSSTTYSLPPGYAYQIGPNGQAIITNGQYSFAAQQAQDAANIKAGLLEPFTFDGQTFLITPGSITTQNSAAPSQLSQVSSIDYSKFGNSTTSSSSGGNYPTYVISSPYLSGGTYTTSIPYLPEAQFKDMAVDQAYGQLRGTPNIGIMGSTPQFKNGSTYYENIGNGMQVQVQPTITNGQLSFNIPQQKITRNGTVYDVGGGRSGQIQFNLDNSDFANGWKGAGYYLLNNKPTYVDSENFYTSFMANSINYPTSSGKTSQYTGNYLGPDTIIANATNNFLRTMAQNGWTTDTQGNLYVNGQQPTISQAEAYSNALVTYQGQANKSSNFNQQSSSSTTPSSYITNWYSILSNPETRTPQTGAYIANLASVGINPNYPSFMKQSQLQYEKQQLQNIQNQQMKNYALYGSNNAPSHGLQGVLYNMSNNPLTQSIYNNVVAPIQNEFTPTSSSSNILTRIASTPIASGLINWRNFVINPINDYNYISQIPSAAAQAVGNWYHTVASQANAQNQSFLQAMSVPMQQYAYDEAVSKVTGKPLPLAQRIGAGILGELTTLTVGGTDIAVAAQNAPVIGTVVTLLNKFMQSGSSFYIKQGPNGQMKVVQTPQQLLNEVGHLAIAAGLATGYGYLLGRGAGAGAGFEATSGAIPDIASKFITSPFLRNTLIYGGLNTGVNALFGQTSPKQVTNSFISGLNYGANFAGILGGGSDLVAQTIKNNEIINKLINGERITNLFQKIPAPLKAGIFNDLFGNALSLAEGHGPSSAQSDALNFILGAGMSGISGAISNARLNTRFRVLPTDEAVKRMQQLSTPTNQDGATNAEYNPKIAKVIKSASLDLIETKRNNVDKLMYGTKTSPDSIEYLSKLESPDSYFGEIFAKANDYYKNLNFKEAAKTLENGESRYDVNNIKGKSAEDVKTMQLKHQALEATSQAIKSLAQPNTPEEIYKQIANNPDSLYNGAINLINPLRVSASTFSIGNRNLLSYGHVADAFTNEGEPYVNTEENVAENNAQNTKPLRITRKPYLNIGRPNQILPADYGIDIKSEGGLNTNPETSLRTKLDVQAYLDALKRELPNNPASKPQITALEKGSPLAIKASKTMTPVLSGKIKYEFKGEPPEVGEALVKTQQNELNGKVFNFGSSSARSQLAGINPEYIQRIRNIIGLPETNPLGEGADLDTMLKNPLATQMDSIAAGVNEWYNVNKALVDLAQTAKGRDVLRNLKVEGNNGELVRTYSDKDISKLKNGVPIKTMAEQNVINPDGSHLTDIHYLNENGAVYPDTSKEYSLGAKIKTQSGAEPTTTTQGIEERNAGITAITKLSAALDPVTLRNTGAINDESQLQGITTPERIAQQNYQGVLDYIKTLLPDKYGNISFQTPADYRLKDPAKAIEYLKIMNAQNWGYTETGNIDDLYKSLKDMGQITPKNEEDITALDAKIAKNPYAVSSDSYLAGAVDLNRFANLASVPAPKITTAPLTVPMASSGGIKQASLNANMQGQNAINTQIAQPVNIGNIQTGTTLSAPATSPSALLGPQYDPLTAAQQQGIYASSLGNPQASSAINEGLERSQATQGLENFQNNQYLSQISSNFGPQAASRGAFIYPTSLKPMPANLQSDLASLSQLQRAAINPSSQPSFSSQFGIGQNSNLMQQIATLQAKLNQELSSYYSAAYQGLPQNIVDYIRNSGAAPSLSDIYGNTGKYGTYSALSSYYPSRLGSGFGENTSTITPNSNISSVLQALSSGYNINYLSPSILGYLLSNGYLSPSEYESLANYDYGYSPSYPYGQNYPYNEQYPYTSDYGYNETYPYPYNYPYNYPYQYSYPYNYPYNYPYSYPYRYLSAFPFPTNQVPISPLTRPLPTPKSTTQQFTPSFITTFYGQPLNKLATENYEENPQTSELLKGINVRPFTQPIKNNT